MPVRRHEDADDRVGAGYGAEDAHASAFKLRAHELAGEVGAPFPHDARVRTEHRRPGRNVRCLPPGGDANLRLGVGVGSERPLRSNGHVHRQVAESADTHARNRKIRTMDGVGKRRSIRSFLLGGVVGASAVVATLDRRRRIQRRRGRPRGLAAFESAPCYLELLEKEREDERSAP